jgi:hypothetical protein
VKAISRTNPKKGDAMKMGATKSIATEDKKVSSDFSKFQSLLSQCPTAFGTFYLGNIRKKYANFESLGIGRTRPIHEVSTSPFGSIKPEYADRRISPALDDERAIHPGEWHSQFLY